MSDLDPAFAERKPYLHQSHLHRWISHWALRIPWCADCLLDMPDEMVATLAIEAQQESWWPK